MSDYKEWGSDVTFSTHNQWRCSGKRPDGRPCNRLLALANANHTGLFVKRKDSSIFIFDLGGSGIVIECPGCSHKNSLFSLDVDKSVVEELISSDYIDDF